MMSIVCRCGKVFEEDRKLDYYFCSYRNRISKYEVASAKPPINGDWDLVVEKDPPFAVDNAEDILNKLKVLLLMGEDYEVLF